MEQIESLYHEELRQDMPITYIALDGEICVGACTLELNCEVRPDLAPWIESVVVDPAKNIKSRELVKGCLKSQRRKQKNLALKDFTYLL